MSDFTCILHDTGTLAVPYNLSIKYYFFIAVSHNNPSILSLSRTPKNSLKHKDFFSLSLPRFDRFHVLKTLSACRARIYSQPVSIRTEDRRGGARWIPFGGFDRWRAKNY